MMFDETADLDMSDGEATAKGAVSRRAVLRLGAVGATGAALAAAGEFGAPYLAQKGLLSTDGAFAATATALGDLLFYKEKFPTSPLILNAVQRPADGPEGPGAGEDARGRRLGGRRRGRATASRTRCATSATSSGPATSGPRTRSSTRSSSRSAPTRSPRPQVLPINSLASRGSLRRHRQEVRRRASRGSCRPARSTGSTASSRVR